MDLAHFPSGLSIVPFVLDDNDTKINMKFVSGFLGVQQVFIMHSTSVNCTHIHAVIRFQASNRMGCMLRSAERASDALLVGLTVLKRKYVSAVVEVW